MALSLKPDATARLIEPKGSLIDLASLKLDDCFVVDDFKVLQNGKGISVGIPSEPGKTSRADCRDTSRPITRELRAELAEAVTATYYVELEKLQIHTVAIISPEK